MICKTLILAAALAGHYPGTCVLQCDIRNAWVGITSDDRRHGTIRDEHGWFDVHDWGNGSRRPRAVPNRQLPTGALLMLADFSPWASANVSWFIVYALSGGNAGSATGVALIAMGTMIVWRAA